MRHSPSIYSGKIKCSLWMVKSIHPSIPVLSCQVGNLKGQFHDKLNHTSSLVNPNAQLRLTTFMKTSQRIECYYQCASQFESLQCNNSESIQAKMESHLPFRIESLEGSFQVQNIFSMTLVATDIDLSKSQIYQRHSCLVIIQLLVCYYIVAWLLLQIQLFGCFL